MQSKLAQPMRSYEAADMAMDKSRGVVENSPRDTVMDKAAMGRAKLRQKTPAHLHHTTPDPKRPGFAISGRIMPNAAHPMPVPGMPPAMPMTPPMPPPAPSNVAQQAALPWSKIIGAK